MTKALRYNWGIWTHREDPARKASPGRCSRCNCRVTCLAATYIPSNWTTGTLPYSPRPWPPHPILPRSPPPPSPSPLVTFPQPWQMAIRTSTCAFDLQLTNAWRSLCGYLSPYNSMWVVGRPRFHLFARPMVYLSLSKSHDGIYTSDFLGSGSSHSILVFL